MGMWGNGISSNDEYPEFYEEFFARYNGNEEVEDIIQAIETRSREIDDLYVHNNAVYAIAKCLWLIDYKDNTYIQKVKEIIDNDLDIKGLVDLELDERDIKPRRKVLQKFYDSLLKENARPRKRKKIVKKVLPDFPAGTIIQYKYEEKYRYAVLLDRFIFRENLDELFLIGLFMTETDEPLNIEQILKCKFWATHIFDAEMFLPRNKYKVYGQVNIKKDIHKLYEHSNKIKLFPGNIEYIPRVKYFSITGTMGSYELYREIKNHKVDKTIQDFLVD